MGNKSSREERKDNKKASSPFSKKFPFIKKGKSSRARQEQSTTQVQQQPQRESLDLPIQPEQLTSRFSAYSNDAEGVRKSQPEQLTSGFDSDTESENISIQEEPITEGKTSKYKKVAMGKAERATAGEGLETLGLTDCSAIAILSSFDSQNRTYGDMALFHVSGSDEESRVNQDGAISELQNIAKGEYTVVIIHGKDSASDTAKSMFTGQKGINNLLNGANKKEEHTGGYVSIDRSGKVTIK